MFGIDISRRLYSNSCHYYLGLLWHAVMNNFVIVTNKATLRGNSNTLIKKRVKNTNKNTSKFTSKNPLFSHNMTLLHQPSVQNHYESSSSTLPLSLLISLSPL